MHWYPLQFEPLHRRYLWGGRRLETILDKQLGVGDDYAESWEVVDRGADQSIIRSGALRGLTLHELMVQYGSGLFGHAAVPDRFPLLLKFLDANRDLSVQVHPDDARGARLDPPDLGKTEAWMILHADPGSRLYAGLRAGCSRADLERAVAEGTMAECLHVCEPRVGECYFIPAGTVHALGAGLVVAEIQQASDTTYRLFDWNRVGPDGEPRTLHIEQALEAIDFAAGPVWPCQPVATAHHQMERWVECDKFVLDRWRLNGPWAVPRDEKLHILAVLDGRARIEVPNHAPCVLKRGEVTLIPAALDQLHVEGAELVMMDAYLP